MITMVQSLFLLPLDARHTIGCSLSSIRRKVVVHRKYSNNASLAFDINDMGTNINLYGDGDIQYSISKVSNKARALDVKVFRGFSVSAHEHILLDQNQNNRSDLSEMQAIDYLMKNYDDDGNYIMQVNQESYEPETYFAAIYHGAEPEKMNCFSRQNGIIGVVSAQLRRRAPKREDASSAPSEFTFPTILSPHVYIANMRVHEEMQRQGVGKALLSSVVSYTINLNDERMPVVLSVENDNLGAIQLYEKAGFEYFEKNKVFGLMMLLPRHRKLSSVKNI